MTQVIQIGSIASDIYDNIIQLSASAANGLYNTLQFPRLTQYQVPAGYKLIISLMYYQNKSAGRDTCLGYADVSVLNNSTPPTNSKDLFVPIASAVSNQAEKILLFVVVPSLKYPYLFSDGGISRVWVNGYLKQL